MERCFKINKARGVDKIGLIISDYLTALDTVVPLVFKNTAHQKCIVRLKRTILNKVASKNKEEEEEEEVAADLNEVFNLDLINDTVNKAFDRLDNFAQK